jgi:hypothetical protein
MPVGSCPCCVVQYLTSIARCGLTAAGHEYKSICRWSQRGSQSVWCWWLRSTQGRASNGGRLYGHVLKVLC